MSVGTSPERLEATTQRTWRLPPEYARTPMPYRALIPRRVVFMTANEVARETGWAMHGWSHGDRATNEAFAPLETFGERFDALLARVRGLGFETIDLWGAHLSPDWATDEHVLLAQEALGRHGIAGRDVRDLGRPGERRARVRARARGRHRRDRRRLLGRSRRARPVLARARRHARGSRTIRSGRRRKCWRRSMRGRRHDRPRPSTPAGGERRATTPRRAIEELGEHVAHVHLKDVRRVGEPHETCAWGERRRRRSRDASGRWRGSATAARSPSSTSPRARPERGDPRDARAAGGVAAMRVVLVGAGNIADRYAASIVAAPELELAGATDLDDGTDRGARGAVRRPRVRATSPQCSPTTRSTRSST